MTQDSSWQWYIIQVKSGSEKKIIQNIEHNLQLQDSRDLVRSLIIPLEEVIEVKQGKKVITEKKFYPGYILLEAQMSEKLIAIITKTKDVIKFLGNTGKPSIISKKEIDNIFEQMKNGTAVNQQKILFSIGDSVTVNDGPFHSFTGTIEDIDEEKQRLKVSVTIFGRATPVDLSFTQVTKDNE